MRFTSEPLTERYHDVDITVCGIERWQCDCCGDNVMTGEMAEKHARAVSDEYSRLMGLLPPSEIRALRKSLGLSQREFEKALGVSTPTVSRWETGAVLQAKPVDNLMRLMRDVPEAQRYMTERSGAYASQTYTSEIDAVSPHSGKDDREKKGYGQILPFRKGAGSFRSLLDAREA